MKDIFPKDLLRIVLDTAKEISASGETIHQTFGELSISLERLLTKVVKVTNGNDGSKVTETKEWLIDKDKQQDLVDMYFKKASLLLDRVYENQKNTKQLIFMIVFLIFIIVLLIFFVLPIINNNKITLNFPDRQFLTTTNPLLSFDNQISTKDIMLVVIGGIVAYGLVLLTDILKKPKLVFEIESENIGTMDNKTKHKFIHIKVKNYDKKFPFIKLLQPTTQVAFSTKATIIIDDNGTQREFTGRWSNHPQLLPKSFQANGKVVQIPDINALVQGREDIHPQSRKTKTGISEDKEVAIGLKYDNENEFYMFNNESYIYINNNFKDEKFKFSRGVYNGMLILSTMGFQRTQKFRIYDESLELEDFRVELIR